MGSFLPKLIKQALIIRRGHLSESWATDYPSVMYPQGFWQVYSFPFLYLYYGYIISSVYPCYNPKFTILLHFIFKSLLIYSTVILILMVNKMPSYLQKLPWYLSNKNFSMFYLQADIFSLLNVQRGNTCCMLTTIKLNFLL